MKLKIRLFNTILFLNILIGSVNIYCNTIQPNEDFRGVVLYPSDILSLGAEKLINILNKADVNLIGIHSNSITEDLDSLKAFLQSCDGKLLMELCERNKIDVEFECHVLQEILPRSLFDSYPEYFRIDSNGNRNNDLNMCFSSMEVWDVIDTNVQSIMKWLRPTTNRYFFWIDDSYDGFCYCDDCKSYSPSDQALIFENRMLKILRKINNNATLAHLAYASTLEAPKKVRPEEGIFLEFAPIGRNYTDSLSVEQYTALKMNMKIFPKKTAHVLEYWLDVSMFSNWERDNLTEVPWKKEFCRRDVELYQGLGISSFTTFATWMLHADYFELYGLRKSVNILEEYSSILKQIKIED